MPFYYFSVYGQNTYGIDCGKEANEWISKFIGKENLKLVFFDQAMAKRPANGGYFGEVGEDVPEKAQVFSYKFQLNKMH